MRREHVIDNTVVLLVVMLQGFAGFLQVLGVVLGAIASYTWWGNPESAIEILWGPAMVMLAAGVALEALHARVVRRKIRFRARRRRKVGLC